MSTSTSLGPFFSYSPASTVAVVVACCPGTNREGSRRYVSSPVVPVVVAPVIVGLRPVIVKVVAVVEAPMVVMVVGTVVVVEVMVVVVAVAVVVVL